ncbi:MAG TPA: hypothetical protein VKE70_08985 [Candidatus Solibacter sp.]|nr:hypothetical protein [Candidatus Solibacter sp.]
MRSATFLLTAGCLLAQTAANYDESKVPAYRLPSLGATNAAAWSARRAETLALYEREVFGMSPARAAKPNYEIVSVDRAALGGKAERKLITLYFGGKDDPRMNLLVYLPAKRPAPVFLGLSFNGIHAIADDPSVPLPEVWLRDPSTKEWVKRTAPENTRAAEASRWQVEKILDAGYGLAVAYYFDIEPDFDGGRKYGVRAKTPEGDDQWSAIGAWAWALRCAMDVIERDHEIDAKHVALMGHSRLGKTALWAGAQDTRFSIVISNESGEGGAAISRRQFGERTKDLNTRFPHWFDGNFKKYSDREAEMPFDSHMLMALIAPRGLYVASAEGDQWSDPKGEFLGAAEASKVWNLFGKKGIGTMTMPGLHEPVGQDVRYHIRAGKHDVTEYDWEQYLKFAKEQWK